MHRLVEYITILGVEIPIWILLVSLNLCFIFALWMLYIVLMEQHFVKDNTGATSIEYALIAGFLSILIIAGVTSIGTTVKGTFNAVANALQ